MPDNTVWQASAAEPRGLVATDAQGTPKRRMLPGVAFMRLCSGGEARRHFASEARSKPPPIDGDRE